MTSAPVHHVRRAAAALVEVGATLVAGHSAHVPHGVAGPVLYDLGDFLDDYRVDPKLRNDLGLQQVAVSHDAGHAFGAPRSLGPPGDITAAPLTDIGYFTADYVQTAVTAHLAYTAWVLPRAPGHHDTAQPDALGGDSAALTPRLTNSADRRRGKDAVATGSRQGRRGHTVENTTAEIQPDRTRESPQR